MSYRLSSTNRMLQSLARGFVHQSKTRVALQIFHFRAILLILDPMLLTKKQGHQPLYNSNQIPYHPNTHFPFFTHDNNSLNFVEQ